MKFGFVLPHGDARAAALAAKEAETAGWDGFFVWEPVWGWDAWVCLAAAAMVTRRIRLGTMITPLSRMRPWKLASETVTVDHLSNGRLILAVGLGAVDTGFSAFGETTDRRERAELLDEGLEVLTGLWRGQPFKFFGKHYQVRETDFMPPPPPLQQPRIPIWVVGAWGSQKSMGRALRFDGLLPNLLDSDGKVDMRPPNPDEVAQMSAYIRPRLEPGQKFDLVVEGVTPGEDAEQARQMVQPFEQAGATWWIEALWDAGDQEAVLERVRQGPPVI